MLTIMASQCFQHFYTSKAFDKTNYNIFFAKLIKCNLPDVHKKTAGELVEESAYASKTMH